MFLNLLATSMDRNRVANTHPAFVEIIKSMCPDEALILRFLAKAGSQGAVNIVKLMGIALSGGVPKWKRWVVATNFSFIAKRSGCANVGLTPAYLENLKRLGLLSIDDRRYLANTACYQEIEREVLSEAKKLGLRLLSRQLLRFERKTIELTAFGQQFVESCVLSPLEAGSAG